MTHHTISSRWGPLLLMASLAACQAQAQQFPLGETVQVRPFRVVVLDDSTYWDEVRGDPDQPYLKRKQIEPPPDNLIPTTQPLPDTLLHPLHQALMEEMTRLNNDFEAEPWYTPQQAFTVVEQTTYATPSADRVMVMRGQLFGEGEGLLLAVLPPDGKPLIFTTRSALPLEVRVSALVKTDGRYRLYGHWPGTPDSPYSGLFWLEFDGDLRRLGYASMEVTQ